MTIARELHLADVSSLFAAVGENQVSAQSVVATRSKSRSSFLAM